MGDRLLPVCIALESLGEPYSILAFSGKGPGRVSVHSVKWPTRQAIAEHGIHRKSVGQRDEE